MAILLKSNNMFYDLSNETYNTSDKQYNGKSSEQYDIDELLNNSTLEIEKLFEIVEIGEESFKPIEKFDNFSIISNQEFEIAINENIENKTELLIISSIQINTDLILQIHNFIAEYFGDVKTIISFDEETWYSYDDTKGLIDVGDINVINKKYEDLSSEELIEWNNTKQRILEKGFDLSSLSSILLDDISVQKISFAFVLNNESNLKSINSLFLEQPHFIKMGINEYSNNIYPSKIVVTSNKDSTQIYINALTQYIYRGYSNVISDRLDTPELQCEYDENTHIVNLYWNEIYQADYYKVYVNGVCVNDNLQDNKYEYVCENKMNYDFCIKAYSNTATTLPSFLSNICTIDNGNYLGSNSKFIAIKMNGVNYKLKVR